MISRTPEEWAEFCAAGITAGYSPGGSRETTYESGRELAGLLRRLGAWKPGDAIVDVGCGNGRLAMGLIDEVVQYVGLEPILPCVEFCRRAFEGMPCFRFEHLDVYNRRYWNCGMVPPEEVVYPLPDMFADAVVANSLFSHTATLEVAARNLAEMWRVLKPGGRLFSTWYFGAVPDGAPARTVYRRSDVLALFGGFGIVVEGVLEDHAGQTYILAVKRGR